VSDDANMESAIKQVLASVPGANPEEIKIEFQRYQADFLIPPSDAMRSVIRKFQSKTGSSTKTTSGQAPTASPMKKVQRLSELKADDKNIEIEVEISSHNVRTQKVRGEDKDIAFGFLEDNPNGEGDGKRMRWSFKDWGAHSNIIPGVVVRIEGASVNEYQGQMSLNINQTSRVVVLKESSRINVNPNEPMSLSDASNSDGDITVIGRVLAVQKDVIHRKDGSGTIDVVRGRLGDASGALSFLSWEAFDHEVGTLVKVEKAQVRRFKDNPEMNIGRYTKVEVYHDAAFPETSELDQSTRITISNLRDGLRDVDLVVQLIDLTEREFTDSKGEERKIRSGELIDPSGRCRMTSWSELPFDKSDLPLCLSLQKVSVRAWQGIPDITINTADQITILDETPWDEIDPSTHIIDVDFTELTSGPSRAGIATEATVISIKQDSGIIQRCPECRKLLREGSCTDHGEVDGNKDFRIKLVLDDGISTASTIMNKAASEKFTSQDTAKMEKQIAENGSEAFVADLRQQWLGRRLRVEGRSISDDQGAMLIIDDASGVEVDAILAATEVRNEWGVA